MINSKKDARDIIDNLLDLAEKHPSIVKGSTYDFVRKRVGAVARALAYDNFEKPWPTTSLERKELSQVKKEFSGMIDNPKKLKLIAMTTHNLKIFDDVIAEKLQQGNIMQALK